MVGPGVGEAGLEGIAEEGIVDLVVVTAATLFLIVLSNDSRPSSVEKPRSSWENIAAVKSPMESKGSPSFSTCPPVELIDIDVLRVELC